MSNVLSESILQKRIKRFKSIKRGYYSLIAIVLFYFLSILSPLWINNKPLIIRYANDTYDLNENYIDNNENGKWDNGEFFEDEYNYFFPAFWDLIDFIPGLNYPIYESKYFNQNINKFEVDFRLLDKTIKQKNLKLNSELDLNKYENTWEASINSIKNFIIMAIYPYHPHEDLKD